MAVDYLSEETRENLRTAWEIATGLEMSLGTPVSRRRTGDCAWYLMTDNEPGIANMLILLCTPEGYLVEFNFDEVNHMAAVTDIGDYLVHLCDMGYRKLSVAELEEFYET